jgi:hypothetical protein
LKLRMDVGKEIEIIVSPKSDQFEVALLWIHQKNL